MPRKTQGVYDLVSEVLETIPEPYGQDVIEDVCLAIEKRSSWRKRYDLLGDELTSDVVNNWIGRYTKQITGLETIKQVKAKRSTIITAYTTLHH
jgi:hypothetical protein